MIASRRYFAAFAGLALISAPRWARTQNAGSASAPKVVHHTVTVDGHPIAVWEKRSPHARRALLLVHGRTWSSIPDFDLHVPGENLSVMDALVARGYDVYAIDLRGYGATPRDASGWLTPTRAAEDVYAVLEWIHRQSAIKEKPALIAWSRGSMVAQLVAETHPDAMSALVLFGRPLRDTAWARDTLLTAPPRAPNTAARAVSDFITPGSISRPAIDAYIRQALASDPILVDWRNLDQFNALDPQRVKAPTLLMIGQFDPFYAQHSTAQAELFIRLGTADKEWVILAGGDHAALLERTAPRFVEAIASFLERPHPSLLGLEYGLQSQTRQLSASEPVKIVRDPAAALIDAFRTHSLVLLGEVHRSAEMHAFMRALISSPEFGRVVDDVVVEATNVRYQSLLDRYIAGDSVPRDSLRLVWRNSTQLMLWDSPLYEELVETIRDANRKLPAGHKMRVLASDPPIDWGAVNTPADFPKSYGYRDWQTTEVIEREVLARNHRALVIIGTAHIGRTSPRADSAPMPAERESVGEGLARKHPGAAYVVHTVVGSVSPELETTVRELAAPNTLIPIAGTSLANKNSSLLFGKSITLFRNINGHRTAITLNADAMPPLGAVIDAILYLGPYSHEILPEASLYLDDPQYLAEIRRRIVILTQVYGGDFWSDELNAIIKRR